MKRFLSWYIGSFILSYFLLFRVFISSRFPIDVFNNNFFEEYCSFISHWQFWVVLLLPYLIFQLLRYIQNSFKNQSNLSLFSRFTFSIILPFGLLFSILNFSQWNSNFETFNTFSNIFGVKNTSDNLSLLEDEEKQKGAHVFGYLDSLNIKPFIKNNFDWITMVSYADQKDINSPTLRYYKGDSLKMARRDSMWKSQIDIAHSNGFNVFLKPHIWIYEPTGGKWRSDIFPDNEENWESWQKSYREFILMYAKIAQDNDVELFSIGAELTRLTDEKSEFWIKLIREVRSVYSGKLTYAANWYKEFEKVSFWGELDYIGIQAYFPLVKNKNPNVEQISKGWRKHLRDIESIHEKYNRNVIFTEIGYKSTSDSAIKPWEWIDYSPQSDKVLSMETQAYCYEAFFNTVWKKDWMAGVHIWQTRSDYKPKPENYNMDFTPQGKPAEDIIAKGFEKE